MISTLKVQCQHDKKRNVRRHYVYIPKKVVKRLQIQKGNLVEVDVKNPTPDYVEPIKERFRKKQDEISELSNEKTEG